MIDSISPRRLLIRPIAFAVIFLQVCGGVAQAIQDAYRGGYGYFFPQRFPAAFESAGERQADGKTYQALKVTPKGAEPMEVWFDPASHLFAGTGRSYASAEEYQSQFYGMVESDLELLSTPGRYEDDSFGPESW